MFNQEELQVGDENISYPLKNTESAFVLAIPVNYFSCFPGHMLDIVQLIDAEDPVFEVVKTNSFYIPENYFEQFLNATKAKIKTGEIEQEAFLKSLPEQSPFYLPESYFEQFEQELLGQLSPFPNSGNWKAEEEISVLSPLLAGLKNTPAYEVPEGYFENPRKTIEFENPAVRSIKWMRWAAAVMILCIFSLGGWQFLNVSDAGTVNAAYVDRQLAEISDTDIKEYLRVTLDDYELNIIAKNEDLQSVDNFFQGISDQDIKTYLEDGAY